MRSEPKELIVAGMRVAGPVTLIALFVALYLQHQGQVGKGAVLGIVLLGAAAGSLIGGLVEYGSRASGELLVKIVTAAGDLRPAASFSYQESLLIRGNPDAARAAYEQHLATHPNDVNARLALARLWRDELKDSARAEQLFLEARALQPTLDQEFAIGNALIDLYRAQGGRGNELAELARFAQRFAGTEAGAGARRALARLKAEGE